MEERHRWPGNQGAASMGLNQSVRTSEQESTGRQTEDDQ
jgi:hypothetical protein